MIHIEQRVDNRGWLELQLAVEAHRRGDSLRNAWGHAAGCLDAPDRMPAGGMRWWWVEPDLGLPEQMVVDRP